jgi:hypothetical protein
MTNRAQIHLPPHSAARLLEKPRASIMRNHFDGRPRMLVSTINEICD